jgi:NADH-quinone oxidoreductase subunit C
MFLQMDQLLDVFALDFYKLLNRFHVFYKFTSLRFNLELFLRIVLKEKESVISLMHLFPSSNWLEREVWDLFGIFFEGHSDLRRILTDYGFHGFPMRKDFPLSGFVEIFFDLEFNKVVLRDLYMVQEFRLFEFNSPWHIL